MHVPGIRPPDPWRYAEFWTNDSWKDVPTIAKGTYVPNVP